MCVCVCVCVRSRDCYIASHHFGTPPLACWGRYAQSALLHGATICTRTQVVGAEYDPWSQWWRLQTVRKHRRFGSAVTDDDAAGASDCTYVANAVVNCAGLHSDDVEALRLRAMARATSGQHSHDRDAGTGAAGGIPAAPDFAVTPRKCQYAVFAPQGNGPVLDHVVAPLPTAIRPATGAAVWRTLHGNVVVGPAATDQDSKTDRSPDPATTAELAAWARTVVPALQGTKVCGTHSGLHTATQLRDYHIATHRACSWVTGRYTHRSHACEHGAGGGEGGWGRHRGGDFLWLWLGVAFSFVGVCFAPPPHTHHTHHTHTTTPLTRGWRLCGGGTLQWRAPAAQVSLHQAASPSTCTNASRPCLLARATRTLHFTRATRGWWACPLQRAPPSRLASRFVRSHTWASVSAPCCAVPRCGPCGWVGQIALSAPRRGVLLG